MMFVSVSFFILCWTPVFVIDVIDTFRGHLSLPFDAYIMYTICAALPNAVNPIIYGIVNPTFRKEYLKLLKCAKRMSNTNASHTTPTA